MGASWFVRPETERLPLSDGQWILVKRRLSTGDYRAHLKRSSRLDARGVRQIDRLDYTFSLVIAYLIDWSLDVEIRGVSEQDLTAALDTLDPTRFEEIKTAIDTHEAAMTAEREEKKTMSNGEPMSAPISPLPSVPGPASVSNKPDTLM